MRRIYQLVGSLALIVGLTSNSTAAEPTFRTDGGDDKLPWFQLTPGEFPPEGSSHAVSGELIALDHVNRKGMLRPDRDDTQRRGDWDIARPFVMLPYGSIRYHGAPAELRDIPIGTHLHGQFYADEVKPPIGRPKGKQPPPLPATFTRVILLEDDISRNLRLGRSCRVESVDLELKKLTVIGIGPDGKVDPKPIAYQIGPTTKVWKGRGIATLAEVAAGQMVQLNLTVCTLKGPGRCTDIWIDAESRDVSTSHQLELHRQYQREHGLAGWVDEVDNKQGIVSVTLFGGIDAKLLEAFTQNEQVAAAVAEDSLRTWDQINDVKRGPILEVRKVPVAPGCSGVQIKFKPSVLLEGYRPKRIVRLFAASWKVDDLPREERLYP